MATKRQSQLTLTDCIMWRSKRPALDGNSQSSDSEEENTLSDIESNCESEVSSCNTSSLPVDGNACSTVCCIDLSKVYQPTNKEALESLFNQRNFRHGWFKQYPWLTVCLTKNKVFCSPCRYIFLNKMLTFSKNFSPAFIEDGFNTWRKATKRFCDHEVSLSHREAKMKMIAIGQPALPQSFTDQTRRQQESSRKSLLTQLSCLGYLL